MNSGQTNQDPASDTEIDYDLIDSLILARTTKEVEIMLKKASPACNLKTSRSHVHLHNTNHSDDSGASMENGTIQFTYLTLDITAAAFRRMAHISLFEGRYEVHSSHKLMIEESTTLSTSSKLREKMVFCLFQAVVMDLKSHRSSFTSQQTPKLQELPGVCPLAAILQALAVLANNDAKKEKVRPFAILVVEFLNAHEISELYKLGPIKLVQCLQATAKLNIDHPTFYNKLCRRLLRSGTVPKISARFLSHGLSAIAILQIANVNRKAAQTLSDWKFGEQSNVDDSYEDSGMTMSKIFLRRLRRKKIAQEATGEEICHALVATRNLIDVGAMVNMEDDAAMFGFSCLRVILEIRKNEGKKKTKSISPPRSLQFTPTQMTDIISSWAILRDQRRQDTVTGELLQICVDDKIIGKCSIGQLECIIHSVRKLNATNHAAVTRCVGERFLSLVEGNGYSNLYNIYPDFVVEILRWPIFVHRGNSTVMEPYIKTSSLLFRERSFLKQSSSKEISNFLWFLSKVEFFDENILLNFGRCLLKAEVIDGCSPNVASRILATFTSLNLSKENPESELLMKLKHDLFYSYGGHLLSHKLSPAEVSSAIYAYAKANYIWDKGIFDHLVSLLACSREKCRTRQLSQTIWSCGKMITWERLEMELLDDTRTSEPPYFQNALKIIEEISLRAGELSPSDIAQVVWGAGRLQIQNDELISIFANRTLEISSSLNSIHISNILWGMAKIQFMDGKLIGDLSNRLAADDIIISSPKVASSILFSLGRLRWRDETLFRKLSKIMIDQIQNVNAQNVANTLWAFRAIRMTAPRELLDTWAVAQLGIEPANRYDG